MKQNKETQPVQKNVRKCRGCGIEYNIDNVAREYGTESSVLLGGYHNAACYTKATTKEIPIIDKEKAPIEICGSIVPIAEVERVWKNHCAQPVQPSIDTVGEWTKGPWFAVEYSGYWDLQTEDNYTTSSLLDADKFANAEQNAKLAASAPQLKAENEGIKEQNRKLSEALRRLIAGEISFNEADSFLKSIKTY